MYVLQFFTAYLFKGILYWCLFLLKWQGDKFVARLEIAGTSQFKTLNSERVKKRIDLPVQKNLLTKYFCILWSIILLLNLISLACLKGRIVGLDSMVHRNTSWRCWCISHHFSKNLDSRVYSIKVGQEKANNLFKIKIYEGKDTESWKFLHITCCCF